MQSAKDFNPDSAAKSAPIGNESPKVDKPPSPQVERTVPDPPKPTSPKDAQGFPGAGSALTSPSRAASGQDPASTSSRLDPAESPGACPPSPQSYGLGAAGRYQCGEVSFMPQSEEIP
jgi:hypothetical protein